MMKVSAIIPTYNRRDYIKRAVDSVLAQTVPVDEIIVVDDELSTDGITEFVATWYGSRVRVVRQGGGLSGARRRGVHEARGEWIAFLDSDDEWAPDRNREFLEAAARVPSDVAWIFGDLRVVTDAGEGTTLFEEFGLRVEERLQVFADSLSVQFPFQFGLLQGSFIRRSVLVELDCFSEGLQHSEDLLAGFQVACRFRFAAIPSVVGKYFRTSDLTPNSALLKGFNGPDYFRSRMLCFALAVQTGHRRPWNTRYASVTRGLCKVLVKQGKSPAGLGVQQFRFGGISAKGIAFLCAAMFGRKGVQTWNAVADFRRKVCPEQVSVEKTSGLKASIRSANNANRRA
jgi:glycosyltransferase involved in cell wall biosynthesis